MSIIGYGICFKNGRMHGRFRHVDYRRNKKKIYIYIIYLFNIPEAPYVYEVFGGPLHFQKISILQLERRTVLLGNFSVRTCSCFFMP